jgi:hypothetical protein
MLRVAANSFTWRHDEQDFALLRPALAIAAAIASVNASIVVL